MNDSNKLEGLKHQIECNCILPQFVNRQPVVFHRFNVFSVIEYDGSVLEGKIRPSYARCNNCDAIHKIIEVNTSRQLAKEESRLLPNLNEVKLAIPENVRAIIESYKVDMATWQEAEFIYENEKWGGQVVLFREEDDSKTIGKYLVILGKSLFKIEKFITGEEEDE